MHESLVVAPERLDVPCVSDCCTPSALVDEVHVLATPLLLQILIKRLDS
jgi:hypothetical protein